MAIAGLSAGTILGARHSSTRRIEVSEATQRAEHRALLVLVVVVGALTAPNFVGKFNPAAATSYGVDALALRVRRLADTSAGLTETFLQVIPSMLVVFAATVSLFGKRRLLRVLGAVVLTLYAATAFLSGLRGDLVVALLLVVVYFHYRVRPVRWYEVVFGGAAVYIVVNALPVIRSSADPLEMLRLLGDEVGSRGFEFLGIGRSGELAVSSNLLRLIGGLRAGETDFGWGTIALGQFAAFVPRTVLPDRPDMASELFVKIFYPGVFESGGGYGFFMVQDGYWDFGLLGAFFYSFIFAYSIERLYLALRRHFQSDAFVFLYALVYSQFALSVVRSGIIASTKATLIAALPALMILGVSRLRIAVSSTVSQAPVHTTE